MAQRTMVVMVDDLDGTEIKDGAGQTVTFSIGRTRYELDLRDDNVGKFYDALKPYTEVARKLGGRGDQSTGTGNGRSRDHGDPRDVRAWAASNGIEVSSRGRIPSDVVEQYRAAGN